MKRRRCLSILGGAALLSRHPARAQSGPGPSRVAVLWHAASADEERPYLAAVRQGFVDLGYVEGRTIALEHRFPNEIPERFRAMAAELLLTRPDALLAVGAAAAMAAKNATVTTPVVFALVPDPVGSGLVDSLAHPERNVTGLTNFAGELSAKRLQYTKEALPGISRVGLLINPNVAITRRYIEESETAATSLQLTLQRAEVRSVGDMEAAFDAMASGGAQAVVVNGDGLFFQVRSTIARLALERRLPMCVYSRETLEAGALISYGPDQPAICRRAAVYVDKLLKGAKPSELPVEQPTLFEFLINQKTARALGISIQPSILLRADEVLS